MSKTPSPIALVILDGYGLSPNAEGNPIAKAKKPVLDGLIRSYPFASLNAAEQYVGLRFGEMGNSEVGHINIGAGKVIYQSLPRINMAIEDKSFFSNPAFLKAVFHCKKKKSTLHLVGLVSNGGVHAHVEHLHALIRLCKEQKIRNVAVHVMTDGRDTAPEVAKNFVATLEEIMRAAKVGFVATIGGRYYAMDRNNIWERTKRMYDAMVHGVGDTAHDAIAAIEASYKKGITDEMIVPTVITDKKGNPRGKVQSGDSVLFFNFRPDRARQLATAFAQPTFQSFDRGSRMTDCVFVTMMEYANDLPVVVAFPPQLITMPLARVIAEHGWKQYHIAETEKYAHVTYFFNGGAETPIPGEVRDLVPSPSVATYDLKPEMSAVAVTDKLIAAIEKNTYAFFLVNYANPDMVAHTGDYTATVKAIETVDACVGRIVEAMRAHHGTVIITADHGNAEGLVNEVTGAIDKEHSSNPVPFIIVQDDMRREKSAEEMALVVQDIRPIGILADVAPTILELFDVKQPSEMTGNSLVSSLAL